MSYGRVPYYIWSDGESLHIWSDTTPADQPPVLASPRTYNEGAGDDWDPQPMHEIILPHAVVRQLLMRWLDDFHPDCSTPALRTAIEADFADDVDAKGAD